MSPNFLDGDFVIIAKYFSQPLKTGDVIAVNHPYYGEIIKRICHISHSGIWLVGDNPMSTNTEKMGVIAKKHVIGKVIYHISQ